MLCLGDRGKRVELRIFMITIGIFGRNRSKIIAGLIFLFLLIHFLYRKPGSISEPVINSEVKPVSNPPEVGQGTPGQDTVGKGGQTGTGKGTTEQDGAILKSIRDYTAFFNGLEEFKPKSPSIKGVYKKDKAAELFSNHDGFLFSKEYLENVLDIPDSTFKELKESHRRYVDEHINKLIENFGVSTFGNILLSDPEWGTYHGSSGYVLVGGGRFNWLSYLVIKQIRATGSTLPIELFIATENEYEKDFCEKLLPQYNAHCNLFDTSLAGVLKEKYDIGGFQYKMLAILSSKFENVVYVDSDNFPTRNIEYILQSELYKEKNLILWPDAWARTTNPKFYEIAGVEVKEKKVRYSSYDKAQAKKDGLEDVKPLGDYNFKNSAYHDFEGTIPNPTSETGMFVINKTSHLKTLLLCLYYNVFGPHYYYPLLTQGSAGEGDKETFIAAAHVMGEPWYQTLKGFKWTGYVSETDNKFTSKALGHYDPIQSVTKKDDVDIVFMHLSYPKYYPNWLVDNHDLVYEGLGKHIRMYADINDNVGYDFDLRALQFFTQGMCPNYYDSDTGLSIDGLKISKSKEYMGKYLGYVSGDEEKERQRCENVFIPHLKWLKETTKYPDNLVAIV